MNEESDFANYKGQFMANVGCTILIHSLMTLVGGMGVVLASTFQDFIFIAIFFIFAIAGYPLLGYLILQVLPKRNLFSVFALSLLLAVISLALIAKALLSGNYLDLFSLVNFPAYMIATMFIGFGGIIDFAHAEHFAFFVAAFIPSPLMYLGLRLRMRKEKRGTSAA